MTGAKAWRIYRGRTQLVVMAFDAKGRPMDGIRLRHASKNARGRWAVSYESLRHGGVLQLDENGKSVKHTLSDADGKMFVGAARVLAAWSKKKQGGAITTKAFHGVSSEMAECSIAATGAVRDCAPLVAQCVRWARVGAVGGWRGAGGAALACLAWNWRRTASCAAGTADAARSCYAAWNAPEKTESEKNPEPGEGDGPAKSGESSGTGGEPEARAPDDPESPEGDPAVDEAAWESEESAAEAEAAAEDPEAPLDEEVEDGESSWDDEASASHDDYDANPSDPEEEAISDDTGEDWSESYDDSSEYASEDEGSYDDGSYEDSSYEDTSYDESADDVETESFSPILVPLAAAKSAKTSTRSRAGACPPSRVLQCGARGARDTSAFCRCVK